MVQIVQGKEGFGSLLGRNLGTGISESLNTLAQHKLQNLLQQQQAPQISSGLESLGIPRQEAQKIAMLPQELQSLVVKNYLQGAETAGLDQALQGLAGEQEPQQQMAPEMQQMLQQAPQQQRNPFSSMQDIAKSLLPQAAAQQMPATQQPTSEQPRAQGKSLADVLKNPRLSPEHKIKVAALQQQRQQHLEKISAREQENLDKETKPIYDKISKGYEAAKENNIRLDRMEELVKKGDLSTPVLSAGLDFLSKGIEKLGIALDLRAALTADSQEFNKLSADFVKSAKEFFGGRVTDQDLKAFMQTVPTLLQTNEGKLRLINNLKMFNEIAIIKKKASDKIREENGGRRPWNYDTLIEDRTERQIDAIAEKFRKGIEAPRKNIVQTVANKIPVIGHVGRLIDVI